MNNPRQDFSVRAAATIENFIARLENEPQDFSENCRRAALRTLHTLKGSAQVFAFSDASSLAHELENLVIAVEHPQILTGKNYKSLLIEGFRLLKKTFEKKDFKVPASFLDKLRSVELPENKRGAEIFPVNLPPEIFSQLSGGEKNAVESALRRGRNIACLEIVFKATDFAVELKNFREVLQDKCEIIAVLPGAKTVAPDRIGFQILVAASEDIEHIAAENFAEIVFRIAANNDSDDSENIFALLAAHGKSLAAQLGKDAKFEIDAADETEVSPLVMKIISDALPHLVRNAVDHAVERREERIAKGKNPRATIKIGFSGAPDDGFRLTVSDDGRGIDAEKIKILAIEKKLISPDENLPEKAIFDLIFLPEFSTAERLTEISGRGVGLDAVKEAVEGVGGTIAIESRAGLGTTFEIFLPEIK